jgi:hypothetical protein
MTRQIINLGTADKGNGDPIRVAFEKANSNFAELYAILAGGGTQIIEADVKGSVFADDSTVIVDSINNKIFANTAELGNIEITGSTVSTSDSSGITVNQIVNLNSDVNIGGNLIPNTANGGDLGSVTKPWKSLYVSNRTIFLGNVPLSLEPGSNELQINNVPISQTINYANIPNTPTDISDLTDTEGLLGGGGGGAGPVQTHLELTDSAFIVRAVILDTPVSFTRTANGSQTDAIAPGLRLARGAVGALYNAEVEQSYNRTSHAQPTGTAWNADGWGDLSNLTSRSYTTLFEALNQAVGENIIGAELVMWDTINGKFYKFSFTDWGGANGGSFAYTRTRIEDPNYFRKLDYATANNVDVIEDDSTLQIGITRDNNGGIYNPFTEEEWDSDVSPDGTEWNIDGWDDLTDIETRTYTNFYDVYDEAIGNNILGSKAVMYVPSIDKYYAIQWLSWTQNNAGGGFSYLRYEIDLDKLDEGVRFADGTVQKTAYVPTNVKLTAPDERRIEEVSGYKSVSVTERMLRNLTTTASRNYDGSNIIWFDSTTTTIDEILDDPTAAGIIDNTTVQFSLDETTWYTVGDGSASDGDERGYFITLNGATLTYDQGDTVYFRYVGGGGPVVWWDKDDLPGGSSNFRGAVIDYHAYIPGRGTIVGTIHIVDDDGEENITHTEVSSGASDLEYSDLWYVTSEGEIKYRQLDGDDRTLKIQWTAKVFYGSEYYND